jgi:hypothetical protein
LDGFGMNCISGGGGFGGGICKHKLQCWCENTPCTMKSDNKPTTNQGMNTLYTNVGV